MFKQSENFLKKGRNYKKVPNRNHRAEEYNNWNGKLRRGIQQQTSRGKDQWTQGNENSSSQKNKRKKMSKNTLKDLCDTIKWTNICIIGVPEVEEKEKGAESLVKEISLTVFLTWWKKQIAKFRKHREIPKR